jgi:hypothetical protein
VLTSRGAQRATGWSGAQAAFLQDYDVEVAEKSTSSDPIVGIRNLGLAVDLRATPDADARHVRLTVLAHAAALAELRPFDAKYGQHVELPRVPTSEARGDLLVPAGRWAVLDRSGAEDTTVRFLVRAVTTPFTGAAAAGARDPLTSPLRTRGGALAQRALDLRTLLEAPAPVECAPHLLSPSNFAPPEPPELAEPTPALGADAVVDLVRAFVAPDSWDRRGVEIAMQYGHLYLRQTPDVLDAVEALVGQLRRRLVWTAHVDLRLVETDDADRVRPILEGGALPSPDAMAGLEAALADGSARTVGRLRIPCMQGVENRARHGELHAYLADYDVEIASDAQIGNPIVQEAFLGTEADVDPARCAGGDAAAVQVQLVRTHRLQTRTVDTPHGPLELPRMDLDRFRTTVTAAAGRTTLVAADVQGSTTRLLLLRLELPPTGP